MASHPEARIVLSRSDQSSAVSLTEGHARVSVWHHGAPGTNNDPLVGTSRDVLAQALDERDLSGRVEPA